MTILVRDNGGTQRTITGIQVRDGTNTPRTITEVQIRDSNNVSRVVFSTGTSPFSISADTDNVAGYGFGGGIATTDTVTVTASGGTAPYTYAWVQDTYSGSPDPTINTPTGAATNFTATGVASFEAGTFTCTVTDAASQTAQVTVSAFFSNGSPP